MSSDRLLILDVLRGFAVMGIVVMNIVVFAMPEDIYFAPAAFESVVSPAVLGVSSSANQWSWFWSFVLFDGKMRGLFSVLYGASLVLISERATAKGESAAKIFYYRSVWLGVLGLVHYFLFWVGDILFAYAVIGCLAFGFRGWEPQRLIRWALIFYGIGFVIWGFLFGFWAQMEAFDPMRDFARELAIYRGDYADIVAFRFNEWSLLFDAILLSVGETLPFMMLGMAFVKNGFLTKGRNCWSWSLWLIPAGLFLNIGIALAIIQSNYAMLFLVNGLVVWALVPRLMLTIGYASLAILAIRYFAGSRAGSRAEGHGCVAARVFARVIVRVSAVGRVALTNYLGTTLCMTSVFYGYGLGLFGSLGRGTLWLFVLGAWAIMLFWSKPWLESFRYGPLEWLWRSLARGKLQAMRH